VAQSAPNEAGDDGGQVAGRTEQQAEMFANRLRKNDRHLSRWARREGVSCFRVYDCDIPELPLAVDRYGDALVIAWYAPRLAPDLGDGSAWLGAMEAAASQALDVPPDQIFSRIRAPQKGAEQYTRIAPEPALRTVVEGGLHFEVDLAAYLDVGLFLDHRPLRTEVGASAKGKDILNLFCYTGAFSVHAAAGGARSTTSVDLNRNYLGMAETNLQLNGFSAGREHTLVRADVTAWLPEQPAGSFDVAIVDPPTFSNSKKMLGVFDVQRDHPRLLSDVFRLMRAGGVVYFSTNNRKFKPDFEAFQRSGLALRVEELSTRSVPPDFRDRKIHRAWRFDLI